MSEITRKNWPDGWIPSDNAIGGRKTGLLRMDNLFLDDNGIVKLVPGLSRVNSSPFSGTVHSIYSQNFDNQKVRFVGLTNGTVMAGEANLIEGGNAEVASFLTMFGWVFAASGKKIVRYNVATVEPVGLHKPEKVVVTNNVGPVCRVVEDYSSATVDTGTLISATTDIQFTTAETLGVVSVTPTEANTLKLSSDGTGADTDKIQFPFNAKDSSKIVRVRIEFYLGETDYYFFQWEQGAEGSPLNEGTDVVSVLSARRSEFTRVGGETELGWEKVEKVRLSVVTTGETEVAFQRVSIFGGNEGTLSGPYQYRVVSVAKAETNGVTTYLAKSPASDPSDVIYTNNNTVNVYVTGNNPKDYFVDEKWIYRRSADASFDINPLKEPRRLARWYRVGIIKGLSGQLEDKLSDADAITDGEVLDETIASMAEISEDIAGMVSTSSRIFYITNSQVIPSVVESPDSYRPAQVIRLSGSNAEKNLWITKGADGVIYVGTTEDVYSISGTFQTLNDGTIDANVRGLGLGNGFQPISRSVTYARGSIFYLSANGWIMLNGSNPELLVGDLDFLFRKTSRHEFPFVNIVPNGLALYAVCVRRNQLWCSNVMSDGTRRIFIYDFERKYWHVRNLDPVALFCEDDGTILGGFGGGSGNYLNELDTGTDLAGINGQNFHLLTVFDDFDKPNQRKDAFTLRLWGKSNKAVSIEMAVEGGGFVSLGQINFGPAGSEHFINLNTNFPTPEKSFALQIKGTDVSLFEFYGAQYEFEERPVQVNYLRIPPTNLGTISRKRFTSYALVLDTLGSPVSVTPYVDNVLGTSIPFTTSEKLTIIYFFLSETVGTDIGAILRSTDPTKPFEYYTPNLEETVSEKLPTPTKFLVIPANDYGNPNRKRHSSYKFSINTRGKLVRFTPRIDGVDKSPIEFSTSEKRTQAFYFISDNIGVDIGGRLESIEDFPFEFYGVIVPQDLEIFPPQLQEFRIPESNFGIPSRKRVRTLPMRLNTNGSDVVFTPIVDGTTLAASTFNTIYPQTVFHYFTTDVFGIDFAGELIGNNPFEFHGLLKPEEVEILPVAKQFDQIGPIQLDRIGKLLSIRIRGIFFTTSFTLKVLVEDVEQASVVVPCIPNVDRVYEVMQFPKTISGTTMRFTIGPEATPFHRYGIDVKVNILGMATDAKWIKLK